MSPPLTIVCVSVLPRPAVPGLDLQLRVWQQDYGYESDALHKLEPWGHPYPRCSIHLQRNNISKLRCHGDEWSS